MPDERLTLFVVAKMAATFRERLEGDKAVDEDMYTYWQAAGLELVTLLESLAENTNLSATSSELASLIGALYSDGSSIQ